MGQVYKLRIDAFPFGVMFSCFKCASCDFAKTIRKKLCFLRGECPRGKQREANILSMTFCTTSIFYCVYVLTCSKSFIKIFPAKESVRVTRP